ncbi:polar amino acid transport system substrate-binding protein [Arthrobacter pascens]|uniref:substrate-binding periplasmic protein n=1 Tax=Arthrobacter pascens TaxID=1677 RepID=UPI002792FAF7|nr:transporter substrate-binding domain-containing protein [Arthrobacter pascens]MDQ0676979.1 polar amino acid transport system substrate-binding protein [Arthrobacter pascens]
MKNQKTAFLAALAFGATALSGCSAAATAQNADCKPAHTFPTVAEGKLSVVLYDLPPFSKLEGNKVTGVDGDIVNAIAEMECLTVSAKSVATAANIPTVQAGRADVSIAAWYRTASRAEIVGLTDPIYTDQMAIISKDGLDDAEQLKGKSVGTVDGYLWVDDMKKLLGDSLKVYPTTLNMNQDLAAGRIDVGIDSYGSAQFNKKGDLKVAVIKPHEAIAASKEAAQIAIPVPQKNTELLAALNADLKTLRESGKLEEILKANGLDASAADTGEARLIK